MVTGAFPLWKTLKDELIGHLLGLGGFAEAPKMNEGVCTADSPDPDCPCLERDKWAVHSGIQRAAQWKTARVMKFHPRNPRRPQKHEGSMSLREQKNHVGEEVCVCRKKIEPRGFTGHGQEPSFRTGWKCSLLKTTNQRKHF